MILTNLPICSGKATSEFWFQIFVMEPGKEVFFVGLPHIFSHPNIDEICMKLDIVLLRLEEDIQQKMNLTSVIWARPIWKSLNVISRLVKVHIDRGP